MSGVLEVIALFILITTLLAVATRGREIRVLGKRLVFTIGGVLLFLGGEHRAERPRPLGRAATYAMVATLGLGVALFYIAFLPMLIDFIERFFLFSLGALPAKPQPPIIPAPLLFQYTDILIYIIVSIGVGVVIHELLHAITALREGVNIKSWGLGLLFLFPVAFVELDEDSYRRVSAISKLRILSAGIFANAIVAALSFLALLLVTHSLATMMAQPAVIISSINCDVCSTATYSGTNISSTIPIGIVGTCPAKLAGLKPKDIIVSINGSTIHSLSDLANVISRSKLNNTLILRVCSANGSCREVVLKFIYRLGIYGRSELVAFYRLQDSRIVPCMGVELIQSEAVFHDDSAYIPPQLGILVTLQRYLTFLFMVNFSLYVLNAIPLLITDGSKVLEVLAERYVTLGKLHRYRIVDMINIVVVGLAIVFATYILLAG